jgi:hypothetical protein
MHKSGLLAEADTEELEVVSSMISLTADHLLSDRPYKLLEIRYIFDLAGLPHSLPANAIICQCTALARPIDTTSLTEAEIRAIAHAIIYLSNMGLYPISYLAPSQVQQVRWALEQLLGKHIQDKNWDLLSLLLLSYWCFTINMSTPYHLGWKCLRSAQIPEGAILRSGYALQEVEYLRKLDQRYRFDECYHTTLVAAIAAAVSLSSKAPH